MKTHIGRMLKAMTWADAQSLTALSDHAAAQSEALPLFAHVLAAEETWLARLEAREPRCPVWPTLSIPECEALAAEIARGYQAYFEKLTDIRPGVRRPLPKHQGRRIHQLGARHPDPRRDSRGVSPRADRPDYRARRRPSPSQHRFHHFCTVSGKHGRLIDHMIGSEHRPAAASRAKAR